MTVELIKKIPTITIKEETYVKLLTAVRSTDLELTFIFDISRAEKEWKFIINDVYFPPQWNEPAESKTIDSQYAQWCFTMIKSNKHLNGHGHSHPRMTVSPSGYDAAFFENLKKETNNFQFRFIINQTGHLRCDLIDVENGVVITKLSVIVECEGYNIISSEASLELQITDKTALQILDITADGKAKLLSKNIIFTAPQIELTKDTPPTTFKPTRRQSTDEALSAHHRSTPPGQFSIYDYEDDYMANYYAERGTYGYKKR